MKQTCLSVITLLSTVLITSCGKEYTSKPHYDKTKLNSLFKELRTTEQHFTVTAGTTTHITGKDGTSLIFSPTSFKDAAGNIVNSGSVQISMIEMYKAGSMIANRASTMCGNQLLRSGGQIQITATLNGQQLYSNGYKISFRQPVASSQPMNLFYGNANNTDSVVTWETPTYDSGSTTEATEYESYFPVYAFNYCNRFGWINCDALQHMGDSLTTVTVEFKDGTYNPSNTEMYLYFPDFSGIMSSVEERGGSSSYNDKTYEMTMMNGKEKDILPIGWRYKLITISRQGNFFWTYHSEGTVTRNMHLKADVMPYTIKNLVAYLDSL